MDFNQIKEGNERRKELAESMKRAKEQFDYQRKCHAADAKEMTGAARAEFERIREGGFDYSLFNYVLYTVSYKDCENAQRSCQRTYEGLYPYLTALQKQNRELRRLAFKYADGFTDLEDVESLNDIMKTPEDYFLWAKEQMGEIQKRALERSKTSLYGTDGKLLRG